MGGNFGPAGSVRDDVKRLAVVAVVVSVLVSCSGDDESSSPAAPAESPGPSTSAADGGGDVPSLMAVALEQLVTNDHTFGAGPPPFTEYLLRSHVEPDGEGRALTTDERAAIEGAIRPFGPVRWIDDADEWQTDDLRPTIEGSVILGVGEPTVDGASALVPVSLWCGGRCGTWLTYRADRVDDTWQVQGTEGPVAVA
jgi:hypothetical protein